MSCKNDGDIPPYVWAITAVALVGALYVTFGQKGGHGGKGGGDNGVYVERSQRPCPTSRGGGRGGRGGERQEADWEE